ncbi:MAG: glycine cleavage system protein R [Pseudomonadota bacterium]
MATDYLVLSALGNDRPGIVDQLARAASASGCNIEDSRMSVMGGEFAVLMLVSGSEAAIAAMEKACPSVGKELDLALLTRRTRPKPRQAAARPYRIEVSALDQPGLVHELANFFASRHINIESLDTSTYAAPHTGSQMFALAMTVNVTADTPVAGLRETFLDHCDARNLDASFEAARP